MSTVTTLFQQHRPASDTLQCCLSTLARRNRVKIRGQPRTQDHSWLGSYYYNQSQSSSNTCDTISLDTEHARVEPRLLAALNGKCNCCIKDGRRSLPKIKLRRLSSILSRLSCVPTLHVLVQKTCQLKEPRSPRD